MARLPLPGGDDGSWGDVLNDFLSQSHTASGAIKPGAVTKSDVGLPNVDNTSDVNKPISTAQQTALSTKQNISSLNTDVASKVSAVGPTQTQVDARAIAAVEAELPRRLTPFWTGYGDSIAKPTRPGIVAIGDSITDNNHTATAWTGASYSRTSAYRADGYLTRAMILARQRCSWFDVGVSGETTAQMLARFDTDVTPLRPHIIIEAGGTNDARNGVAAATIIANKQAMWNKAYAFGARVIATTVPPAADTDTTKRRVVQEVNAWLKEYARSNPLIFTLVDWYADLVDPLTGGVKTALMAGAGFNLNSLGALTVAPRFVAAFDKLIPATFDPLPSNNIDDAANYIGRPLLTGTIGGMTGNFTGVVTQGGFGSTSATSAVGSKIARADGYGDWQQIVATGTGNSHVSISVTSGWAIGDTLQATVEFETDAAGWVDGAVDLTLTCFATDGVTGLHISAALGAGSDPVVLGRIASGILRTPPIVVPTGTISMVVDIKKLNAGTARFGRLEVRKLV